MRWSDGGKSSDVEDRRGGGGGGFTGRRVGLGGSIVLLVLSLVFGKNLFRQFGVTPGAEPAPAGQAPRDEKMVSFVSFVLDDNQSNWDKLLQPQTGVPYRRAKMVLFDGEVSSACGTADSAVGPFYCPGDDKLYLDLGFFGQLKEQLGAPGDFAQAYVIAHEVGHHVQNILGTEEMLRKLQRGKSKQEQNDLSVRMELQADCFAGIWANSTSERNLLEQGDIEEAMGAAAGVGDDRLQKAATGRVNPEKWTHGSSKMRMTWFKRGMETGKVSECDTFKADLNR